MTGGTTDPSVAEHVDRLDDGRDTPLSAPSSAKLAAARANTELLRLHAEYCKVVANEHRLAILYALDEKERSVGDLAHELGLTLANVSQHLRVMKARGLVAGRRDGRVIHYSVANPKLVAACHLIREALVEQHLINEAIILGDDADRDANGAAHGPDGSKDPDTPDNDDAK